jgi:nucleotide-binding universal stress UspA family protein
MKKLNKILVPLDGSKLSEKAFEAAFTLAKLSGAGITFLRVLRPVDDIIKIDEHNAIYVDEQIEYKTIRATKYLESVKDIAKKNSIPAHIVVETGLAAEIIIEYAKNNFVDLIVMATHGRTGLQRWFYGSTAAKVLSGANHPVLLVRSFSDATTKE